MEEFAGTNLWFRNDAVIAWNKINGGGAQLFCAGGFVFKLDKDAFEAVLRNLPLANGTFTNADEQAQFEARLDQDNDESDELDAFIG